jgi:hypothetical protein
MASLNLRPGYPASDARQRSVRTARWLTRDRLAAGAGRPHDAPRRDRHRGAARLRNGLGQRRHRGRWQRRPGEMPVAPGRQLGPPRTKDVRCCQAASRHAIQRSSGRVEQALDGVAPVMPGRRSVQIPALREFRIPHIHEFGNTDAAAIAELERLRPAVALPVGLARMVSLISARPTGL